MADDSVEGSLLPDPDANCRTLGTKVLGGRPQDCTEITPDVVLPKGDTAAPGDPALHGMFSAGLRDYIAREPNADQTPPS